MTAKEKASEMVQKLYDQFTDHMQWGEAIEIAQYMVDEIMDAMYDHKAGFPEDQIDFWNTVKEEIEKL